MKSRYLVLKSIPYTAHIMFNEDRATSCLLYKGNTTIAPLDLSDNDYYKFLKEFCVYVDYELSKEEPCEN